ncbi:MAG: hypothetical protein ABI868_16180 [Acidobacteriota bacterium]
MAGGTARTDQPRASQQTVTIPPDHNSLVVHLQGQTWVSVSAGSRQLVHNQSPDPVIAFTLAPNTYVVRTDGQIEKVTTEGFLPEPSFFDQLQRGVPAAFAVASDAPDRHVVDGIGEIVADGVSYSTITIQKHDVSGVPLGGSAHDDELFLRSTGGVIMDENGGGRIRSVRLRSGRAAFRLVSEPSPRLVTVSIVSRDPLASKAEIQLEFV